MKAYWTRFAVGTVVAAAVGAYPFLDGSLPTWQLAVRICYFLLLVLSWNLVSGYAGLFSFGHIAFAAIGAYGSGILAGREGLPLPLAMVLGALIAGAVGALLGGLSLRIRGPYLVVVSFAFLGFVQIFLNAEKGLTGGVSGMLTESLYPLSDPAKPYVLGLVLVSVFLLGQQALLHTHWHDYLIALRDNEFAAAALGGHPRRWKVATFTATAAIAGAAGAFYGQFIGFISPDLGSVGQMSMIVAIGMIGGLGTVVGPIVATVLLLIVDDQLRSTTAGLSALLFGAALLIVIVLFPGGLSGVGDRAYELVRGVTGRHRRPQDPVDGDAELSSAADPQPVGPIRGG